MEEYKIITFQNNIGEIMYKLEVTNNDKNGTFELAVLDIIQLKDLGLEINKCIIKVAMPWIR